ncbi:metallophosphoesterase [Halomonas venusta]|uniref:metallophosphoesterase n=1 Tax=Vreelandella venusta TaxID=44935 RepID=UPI00295F36BF|nr:metallophosphoesterase [Halomonas venusta]MDW0360840.1 metallophosphoesterase [Halomonas venusta]
MEKHATNTVGRDFFVGDIHGQYDLLIEAMERVAFDKKTDRLFSVGDLIDRGADSFKCLSLAFEPWFYGVRGNHEMLALNALEEGGKHWDLWLMNGGTWALSENIKEVKQILMEALRHLPYAREVEIEDGVRIGMVHAEPPHDWNDVDATDPESLVWSRARISRGDDSCVANISAVIVGHTILERPQTLGNVIYIDTGAFHTGRLTLIDAREVFE